MKLRRFFLKMLRLSEFLIFESSLFHSDIVGKKIKIIVPYIYWRNIIGTPDIMNPIQNSYEIK